LSAQSGVLSSESYPVGRDTEEGEAARTEAFELSLEPKRALCQLVPNKFIGRCGCTIDNVGDPAAKGQKQVVLEGREQTVRKTRAM
jgi:hypothetical protein